MKEATARIKINVLLEATGWRFFRDATGPANIRLDPSVTIKPADLEGLGENFEKPANRFVDFLLLDEKGFPLLVLEAKATDKNPLVGKKTGVRKTGVRSIPISYINFSDSQPTSTRPAAKCQHVRLGSRIAPYQRRFARLSLYPPCPLRPNALRVMIEPRNPHGGGMLRKAVLDDVDALVSLENHCFVSDRLARRNFRYMLTRANASVLVDVDGDRMRAYVLLLYSNACSMARLYSIAVDPGFSGQGLGSALIEAAEREALEHDCVSMRLEIRKDNAASLALFARHGYRQFTEVLRYYEDQMDALRFEKHLVPQSRPELRKVPFYRQTLDFTCGPSSLMMAMKTLDPALELSRKLELRIWREATTVFMTSGHGGCGPYGLALSAWRRGFELEIHVNDDGVFLGDSVRSAEKKEVMRLVQEDFLDELAGLPIPVEHGALDVGDLQAKFDAGGMLLVLISSYAIYRERFPHWVVVTGFDERFIYIHDPLVQYEKGEALADSLHMPVPRRLFQRMVRYGKAGQKAVLVLRRRACVGN